MVKLDDVIMALEFVNSGVMNTAYFDSKKKEFIYVNDMINNRINDLNDDYIMLPAQYDIDEYSMMEDFIEHVSNDVIYEDLMWSIRGRGAFRRFKDMCSYHDVLDDWYKFRDEKYKELAINWCKKNNIDFKE